MIDFESLHSVEIEWIRLLHTIRTSGLDSFIKPFDYFDNYQFFFILIPIVWMWSGWRNGFRLFAILLLSSIVNHSLKGYFEHPCPFHLDPGLAVIQVRGYGFPSGAAQTVILLSGILISVWKSPWSWVIATLYVLSVSFSRVYLGVHFPTDILGGWCVGLCLWLIYEYLFPRIETVLENLEPRSLFILSQVIPLLLLIFVPSSTAMTSTMMGLGLGVFLSYRIQLNPSPPSSWLWLSLRMIVGITSIFLFYHLIRQITFSNTELTLFSRYFLLGLWVSFGMRALFCWKKWMPNSLSPN